MKRYTPEELAEVLRLHNLWAEDTEGGQRADLRGADLQGADLQGADLQGADLQRADLQRADLQGADGAQLALAMSSFIPATGAFEGWKKCVNGIIVHLLIPADAKRSHGAERKCRASHVDVLAVIGAKEGVSDYNQAPKLTYRAGERVTAHAWDEDRWNVCAPGIHFFLTREEAEAYSL